MSEESVKDWKVRGLEQVAQESLRHLVCDVVLLRQDRLVDQLNQEPYPRVFPEYACQACVDRFESGTLERRVSRLVHLCLMTLQRGVCLFKQLVDQGPVLTVLDQQFECSIKIKRVLDVEHEVLQEVHEN